MKKNLCIVAMLLISATSFAQNGKGKKQLDGSKKQCPIEQMKKELKLTDAQVEKLQKLDADFRVEHQKMIETRKAEMQKKHEAMKANREKIMAHQIEVQKDRLKSLKGILTADQYVTFLENQFVKSQLVHRGQFQQQGAKRFNGNKNFQKGKCGQGPEQMRKCKKMGDCPNQCGASKNAPNDGPGVMNKAPGMPESAPDALVAE